MWDSHNIPTLLLPHWETAIEYWVDPPGGDSPASDMGIYLYLSTDQVRFCDMVGNPRQLSEVPAILFSEVLRDVGLFVGVGSVENDPAWRDNGDMLGYNTYWETYSFGEFSGTAKIRKEILSNLIPRL